MRTNLKQTELTFTPIKLDLSIEIQSQQELNELIKFLSSESYIENKEGDSSTLFDEIIGVFKDHFNIL